MEVAEGVEEVEGEERGVAEEVAFQPLEPAVQGEELMPAAAARRVAGRVAGGSDPGGGDDLGGGVSSEE